MAQHCFLPLALPVVHPMCAPPKDPFEVVHHVGASDATCKWNTVNCVSDVVMFMDKAKSNGLSEDPCNLLTN